MLAELAEKYGGPGMAELIKAGKGVSTNNSERTTGGIKDKDDYSRCEISEAHDFKSLFVDRFYFGCEADDPTNAWAFNQKNNPFDAEIKTLFGSDIGHFDVQDMSQVLPEAYEMVEHEKITSHAFERFVLENPVRFWGETNPGFFEGTVVESKAAEILTASRQPERSP